MPKMKTKSSAKKRFSIRAGGSIKRGQAFKRHILTKKTTKVKRQEWCCPPRSQEEDHGSRQGWLRIAQQAVQGREGERGQRRDEPT